MTRPGRRYLRVALVAVLAAGVVASATWLVFFSPVLSVREIVIVGNLTIDPREVEQAAGVPTSQPLATVDLAGVERRVLAIRRVESAAADRRWPGTLRIEIVERTPVAVVAAGDRAALLDRHGVVTELRAVAPPGLPVLVADRGDGAATRAALEVIASLPADLARRVGEVRATTPEGISLLLRDGRTVVWGGADRPAAKARILLTLLARPAATYDVSSPEVVTVK